MHWEMIIACKANVTYERLHVHFKRHLIDLLIGDYND